MNNELVKFERNELERLVVAGDLSVLPPDAKARYYLEVCNSMGLNPVTKPFEYIRLNGKEVLYATKSCTEQLRKINCIALSIVSRERVEDTYIVTARATLPDGRTDESIGAVSIGGLKSDALANALMKAETKSKRRVTLSIVGLGLLDESELETIPSDRFAALAQAQQSSPNPKVVESPKRAETPKPRVALPPLPDEITTIPQEILKTIAPLRPLADCDLRVMTLEDLELVIDQCRIFAPKVKTEEARSWLRAIQGTAIRFRDEQEIECNTVPPAMDEVQP